MGCGISRIHDEALTKAVTILVLGPESGGKSALIRRAEMTLNPCDEGARLAMSAVVRAVVRAELAQVAGVALDVMALAPPPSPETGLAGKLSPFLQTIEGEPRINKTVANVIDNLYRNGTLQSIYDLARSEPLAGDLTFVRDVAQRASTPEYLPTDDEMVLCQWSSRGVQVRDFVPGPGGKTRVRFVDVGGSAPEQRKWVLALAEIPFNGVAFVLPLDAIFKTGPSGTNQLLAALSLLRKVLSLPATKEHIVFTFLTKRDRMERMATADALAAAIRSLPVQFSNITSSTDMIPVVEDEVRKIYGECAIPYPGLDVLDNTAPNADAGDKIAQFINQHLASKP